MLDSVEIANFFLAQAKHEGLSFTNLKLQKVVYYAQALYLGVHEKVLFQDEIQAWEHGPVIPNLYKHFKEYKNKSILFNEELDITKFDENLIEFLYFVYGKFGKMTTSALYKMVHKEPLYIKAVSNPATNTICTRDLASYYKDKITYLDEDDDDELAQEALSVINDPNMKYYSSEEVEKLLGLAN